MIYKLELKRKYEKREKKLITTKNIWELFKELYRQIITIGDLPKAKYIITIKK